MRHFKISLFLTVVTLAACFDQALAQSDPEEPDFTGTAFFVSDNGLAITNFHVIEGCHRIRIFDPKAGWVKETQIVAMDKVNDLAILKAEVQSRPLPLADRFIFRRGEEVLTLGYPSPGLQGVNQKATFGRINATTGFSDDIRLVQVDVPVQPGNSGGPLLNGKGEVVGVINARLIGDYQNVSYAVKADYLRPLLAHASVSPASPSLSSFSSPTEIVERSESSVVMVLGYEPPNREKVWDFSLAGQVMTENVQNSSRPNHQFIKNIGIGLQ